MKAVPTHEETHRGISFRKTAKGHWIFDQLPPYGSGYWSRFFTDEEIKALRPKQEIHPEQQVEIMRRAVDRALARQVIYGGDLRYR